MKRLFGVVVTAMILAVIVTFGGMPVSAVQAAGNIGLVFSPLMAPGTWNARGNGTDIYASGKFTDAGGNANADYIARLDVDVNAPTVDAFTATSPSTSLNIPITSFTGSDDVAVTGYIITESATPPSAGAVGWTTSVPTTYTVASDGSYTLYPWAKDAADNVSAVYGSPASVVVDTSTVTNNNDSGAGSLRYAIAGAAPGDTITFDPALSGETIHLASTLDISKSLTIDGSALASKITISGDSDNDGTGDVRVLHIDNVFGISVTLNCLIVTRGLASGSGMNAEGGAILNERALTIRNSIVSNNSSSGPGGAISAYYALTIVDSTFSGNSSTDSGTGGGAIYNVYTLTIMGSTFSGNSAAPGGGAGGAIFNTAPATITNSTFVGNTAALGGAILTTSDLTITNSTIAANSATSTGGLDIEGHITNLSNTIIANNSSSFIGSFSKNDCVDNASPLHLGGIGTHTGNLIEDGSCSPSLSGDPRLGPLADNGGPTQTMALLAGSPAFNAGNDGTCPAVDQRGLTRPQGAHCDIGAYEAIYAKVDANINGTPMVGSPFKLRSGQSTRVSFAGMNSGPVSITSTYHSLPILGAERVIYKVNGVPTSFSEMMGLPNSQLDNTYWLPWYNNIDLDTQLRFANLSSSSASVHVWIGGTEMTGSPFTLGAGESTRQSFAGITDGPVEIVSTVNIVAAERVIYKVNNIPTSFLETMALPNNQLDNTYWLPWYNNVDLDTQLRIGNASGAPATIHVSIGGTEVTPASGITLLDGASTRVSFAGVNDGPVKIESDHGMPIVAAERVIYKAAGGTPTSFSEMMALPDSQLNTTYWLPWYNTADLDTQLRFGNMSNTPATVHIYIGGIELAGSPFSLAVGASTRMSFAGISGGPVQIVSDVNIVAAERVIYKFGGMPVSFSEMMGLPHSGLDTTYWFPWYNNVDLETQLRFGMP